MTAEDRLRDLLRREATTIVPTGDGLARIQERIARRRRARFWVFPSAAVATAAAVAAFVLIAPDDPKTQTLQPASPSAASATSEPTGSAAPLVPDDGGMPLDVPAIWPFTTTAQLAGWQRSYPYAESSLDVGRHFVADYLGLEGVDVSQSCVSCAALQLKVAGKKVGEIALARAGVGFASGHGAQVYTVVSVDGGDLTITSPKAGAQVVSPTTVTGRITGLHENVMLRLLAGSGDELATVGAPAGQEAPWSGTLSWTRTDWSNGSVVGVTRSDKDGAVTRVVALPVTRATGATTASFVGLVDGHVSLFDSVNGRQLRQLTFPPSGKQDWYARWSAGVVVWIRTASPPGCGGEVNRLEGSTASTVTKSTALRYGGTALSPSAGWLAWTEIPCAGSDAGDVVVSGGGAPPRRLAIPSGSVLDLYDVRDDGALLVGTNDSAASGPGTIGLVPAGALTLDGITALSPSPGCSLSSGAAFSGNDPVAYETCGDKVRLARFSTTGSRVGSDAAVTGEPPASFSARGDALVVWAFLGDTYGDVLLVDGGRTTTLIDNSREDCSSIGNLRGCVRDPDW